MTTASVPSEAQPLSLRINQNGVVQWVYDERFDLASLGSSCLRRASFVEPQTDGSWWADLSPVNGPSLGPFDCRSAALGAERAWLEEATAWPSPPSMEVASQPPKHSTQRSTQSMRIILILMVLWFLMSFIGCLDQIVVGAQMRTADRLSTTRESP